MKYRIYYRPLGADRGQVMYRQNGGSLDTVKQEYLRLQSIYPGARMNLVAENDYGDTCRVHSGYWFRTRT